ncbi:hypothetical protein AAFC00_005038 [Neodothiora populina]|uniref:Altered inheritance of mitochondria protein 9, mitochondrial n=1 Tax=Neodothiora populina TaxID=2781224 RepID=A0ABR3P414_9PEZI
MDGTQYHVPELYNYTRGRWLIDDILERNARYIYFNYSELCALVITNCPGAEGITSIEKKEGSNARVFLFTLDNGGKVVAKLPTSVAGPKRLTTSSEVATLEYMRRKANIPGPKILAWSDDANNPIGCEYILMDFAAGVELRRIWFELDSTVQIDCIVKITEKLADMARLAFPAYGSLYLRSSSAMDSESLVPIDEEFCIGPICNKTYWDCTAGENRYYEHVAADRGPYDDWVRAYST